MKLHGIQIDTHKSQSKNLMTNHLVFLENTWKSIYCWRMNGQKILRKNIWKSLYFGIEKDNWKSNCWSSPWIFLLIILLLISEPYQCLKDSCGQFFLVFLSFWCVCVTRTSVWKILGGQFFLSFYHFDEWVVPVSFYVIFLYDPYQCLKDSRGQFFLYESYQCLKGSQIVHENFSWTIFLI